MPAQWLYIGNLCLPLTPLCVVIHSDELLRGAMLNFQVYLSDVCVLLQSDTLHSAVHAHLAHQWTLSLTEDPLQVWLNGQWQTCAQVFIPAKTPHQFADQTGRYLTLLLDADCTTQYQMQLQQLLQQHFGACPATLDLPAFLMALAQLRHISDTRIRQTLQILRQGLQTTDYSAAALAASAGLSTSRFLHLFKQQTGVPLRQFVLWQKLRHLFNLLAQPEPPPLTTLALEAGFYDAAHLANYLRTSFGLSFGDIVQRSQFFQDGGCAAVI